ncbi:MAG: HAD family hydrolase [Pseudomonadota bacterium]
MFLDMDDCLIIKQALFDEAQGKFFAYVSHFGFSTEEVSRKFDAVDTEMFRTHGFLSRRLVNSFEAVLKHFIPDANPEEMGIVRGFADEVFNSTVQLKPGVKEAVGFLAERFPVYIVTQGDESVQKRFLSQLPFRNKLSGEFVIKKDEEAYSRIVRLLELKPSEVVMIGDSVNSDIIPSVKAGLHAIWVPGHCSPLHDKAGTSLPEGVFQFKSLLEAAYFVVSRELPVVASNDGGKSAKQSAPPVPEGNICPQLGCVIN